MDKYPKRTDRIWLTSARKKAAIFQEKIKNITHIQDNTAATRLIVDPLTWLNFINANPEPALNNYRT